MAAFDPATVPCNDISEFQEYLKKLRLVDDRINNKLNAMIPSESFTGKIDPTKQCHDLFAEVFFSYFSAPTVFFQQNKLLSCCRLNNKPIFEKSVSKLVSRNLKQV